MLAGVAETFRDAVLQFCEHGTLQYQWMRYLPEDSISDEFWGQLKPRIEALLKETPILRSWTQRRLYRPEQLRYVAPKFLDNDGRPLFADLGEDIYLAPGYELRDFEMLRPLGVKKLLVHEALDRVESDLEGISRWKAAIPDDWHNRVADFLTALFERTQEGSNRLRIQSLPLIPLSETEWVAATTASKKIYFPTVGPCEIPTDLGFLLVNPTWMNSPPLVKLFSLLGVEECKPQVVISEIYSQRCEAFFRDRPSDLRFLFWHEEDEVRLSQGSGLITEWNGTPGVYAAALKNTIYFPDRSDECSAHQLFQKSGNAPGFSTHFLDQRYLDAVSPDARSRGRSWEMWLEEFLRIRRFPQISEFGKPSKALKYILEYRSDKVLELLRKNWPNYGSQITAEIATAIRKCQVPRDGGGVIKLDSAYLPLSSLKSTAAEFDANPPIFLQIPSGSECADLIEPWKFLAHFGVGFTDDVSFYLHILGHIRRVNSGTPDKRACNSALQVYDRIMKMCTSTIDTIVVS